MTSKILIASDSKARRHSHKTSLEQIRPDSEFLLVKSFQEILDTLQNHKISLIVLDQKVDDAGKHRSRFQAIQDLKEKSANTPIISIIDERDQAITSLKDGADGFIPIHWLT